MLRQEYHNANNPTQKYMDFYRDVANNCISLVKRLKESLKKAKDVLGEASETQSSTAASLHRRD